MDRQEYENGVWSRKAVRRLLGHGGFLGAKLLHVFRERLRESHKVGRYQHDNRAVVLRTSLRDHLHAPQFERRGIAGHHPACAAPAALTAWIGVLLWAA